MSFNHTEKVRYARQTILPNVGEAGQQRLSDAKVLMIGAGGLGTPALLYLAAAGVGTLGIADGDTVDISNLQRQILFETGDVDEPKTDAAQHALHDLNPNITIICHPAISAENITSIIADYDLVLDGTDNFETRFIINDACMAARKTLVSAAIHQFEGQLYTFKHGQNCYRCIYGDVPPEGTMPNCSEAGILGSVAGTLGTMMATEALKEILKLSSLAGHMVVYDALAATSRKISVPQDKGCIHCG
jgi:molybdopterin/thiamine biosynthesis adenylyltransferase